MRSARTGPPIGLTRQWRHLRATDLGLHSRHHRPHDFLCIRRRRCGPL